MNIPARLLFFLAVIVGLTSCTTPPAPTAPPVMVAPPVPPPPLPSPLPVAVSKHEVANRIAAANAIYLARVEVSGGVARYIVAEVWRHDTALGAPPAIGSEWITPFRKADTPGRGESVVIFIVPSKLPGSGRASYSTNTSPVSNDRLVVDGTPIADLRARVASSRAAASLNLTPSTRPTLDECLTASAIYLTRVERRDGLVHFILTEVWRHRQPAGPEGVKVQKGSWFEF